MNKISQLLNANTKPLIMGVLNLTPDSFSDGGKYNRLNTALKHVEYMIENGADIIDIGAESSRPGAETISADEERNRLEPILKQIKKEFECPISVDTYKPEIMKLSIDHGVDMINDIYALQKPGAIGALANSDQLVCLMHMQNTPKNMQNLPTYENIVSDVSSFFNSRISECNQAGIKMKELFLILDLVLERLLNIILNYLKKLIFLKNYHCHY